MAVEGLVGGAAGAAFLVSAGVVAEFIAAACSSPQTTELNAHSRADTLMKWVYIGLGTSALFVGIAAILEPERAVPILLGGGLAAALFTGFYLYAKSSGLASDAPGTEGYGYGDLQLHVVK